jgi:hypothetical protein
MDALKKGDDKANVFFKLIKKKKKNDDIDTLVRVFCQRH